MNKPDHWEDPEFYKARNKELFKDKEGGMSNVNLVKKYEISPDRIRKLYKKERLKMKVLVLKPKPEVMKLKDALKSGYFYRRLNDA